MKTGHIKKLFLSIFLLFPLVSQELINFEKEIIKLKEKGSYWTYTVYSGEKIASGILIDKQGFIITIFPFPPLNEKVFVVGSTGDTFSAIYNGWDELTHITLLKIEKEFTNSPENVSSKTLKEGSLLFVIGNAAGISNTMSIGILSKKEQNSLLVQGNIFPGQSGSPVFTSSGKLCGIVKGTFSPNLFEILPSFQREFPFYTLYSAGTFSVIPIEYVMEIAEELKKGGELKSGWFGVYIDNTEQGVLVKRVIENSPACQSGIKQGDIILEYENKKIEDVKTFISLVKKTKPQKNVLIKLKRNGKLLSLKCKIGERPKTLPYLYKPFQFPKKGVPELKFEEWQRMYERLIEKIEELELRQKNLEEKRIKAEN